MKKPRNAAKKEPPAARIKKRRATAKAEKKAAAPKPKKKSMASRPKKRATATKARKKPTTAKAKREPNVAKLKKKSAATEPAPQPEQAVDLWGWRAKLAQREAIEHTRRELQIIRYHRRLIDEGRTDHQPVRREGEAIHTETMNEVRARNLPMTSEEEGRLIKTIIENARTALTQERRDLTPKAFQESIDGALLRAWAQDEAPHVEALEEERQGGNPFPPHPSDPPVTMRPPDALWLYQIAQSFSLGRALLYLARRYPESETELRQGIVATHEELEARHKRTKRRPLPAGAALIYEKLRSLEPHQAMTLPQIQEWYEDKTGKNLDEGTWKRWRPELEAYGMTNRPGPGYYIEQK